MPGNETGITERLKWHWLHARTNNYLDFPIYFLAVAPEGCDRGTTDTGPAVEAAVLGITELHSCV